MSTAEKVVISVHERVDAPGFVVQVAALGKVAKFPCPTLDEGEALARSVNSYVETGCPVEPLFGMDPDEGSPT
jgi:hypothetical protein